MRNGRSFNWIGAGLALLGSVVAWNLWKDEKTNIENAIQARLNPTTTTTTAH